jgi:hypothetical protein
MERESGHLDFLFDEAPMKSYHRSHNTEPFVPCDSGYERSWPPANLKLQKFILPVVLGSVEQPCLIRETGSSVLGKGDPNDTYKKFIKKGKLKRYSTIVDYLKYTDFVNLNDENVGKTAALRRLVRSSTEVCDTALP